MKSFALICLRLFYAAWTESFCVWNQSFGSSSKKRYNNRMSTHFRSGPAFGLSAEVKSKVSHRSDVVPRFCQALKLTYLKINPNHIKVVYTRFLLYLMAEKKTFLLFFWKVLITRVKSTLQTKDNNKKTHTYSFQTWSSLHGWHGETFQQWWRLFGNVYTNCFNINHV